MIRYIKKRSETNNVSEDKLSIEETVRSILSDIRERGDAALRHYSGHFDNWSPANFRLSEDEIDAAISKLNQSEIEDIKFAQNQIRYFAQKQLETMNELEVETLPGVIANWYAPGALVLPAPPAPTTIGYAPSDPGPPVLETV